MREKIFNVITVVMLFVFLFGVCTLDSQDFRVPIAMVIIGGAWLFYRARDYYESDL